MFLNLTQNVFQLGLWYASDLARSNLRTIVPRTQAGFLTQVYHGKSLNDQDHHYKKYIDRQLNPTMDIVISTGCHVRPKSRTLRIRLNLPKYNLIEVASREKLNSV